jgi:hypothetical protein
VLHEGVVLTPRNLDQGARPSVPRVCPRSGWLAGSEELIGFRFCIITMTGREPTLAATNNSNAPLKFPADANYERRRAPQLSLVRNLARRCDWSAKPPSGPNSRTLNAAPYRLAGPQVLGLSVGKMNRIWRIIFRGRF